MIKIVCPNCGAEYLPAEIYYPNDFFGNPTRIEKDSNGKIIYFSGSSMNVQETYNCDFCGRAMKIKADISFKNDVQQVQNHVTTFKKSNLKLDEN